MTSHGALHVTVCTGLTAGMGRLLHFLMSRNSVTDSYSLSQLLIAASVSSSSLEGARANSIRVFTGTVTESFPGNGTAGLNFRNDTDFLRQTTKISPIYGTMSRTKSAS